MKTSEQIISGGRAPRRNEILILAATLRDISFICANLCDEDRIELDATGERVPGLFMLGEQWIATLDGQPVQAFGTLRATPAGNVLIAWAFGTAKRRRAIPAVTRFMLEQVPRWIASGVTRVEARAIAGHPTAGRWLRALGATETPLPGWGRGGEEFSLLAWTRESWAATLQSSRRT